MNKRIETPLSNYGELAREIFRNLNPATDIHFSQGPMDVLDHSCSKLGLVERCALMVR
jgi:4-hydroxy-3-polyprenylbenzoate decarboxylase